MGFFTSYQKGEKVGKTVESRAEIKICTPFALHGISRGKIECKIIGPHSKMPLSFALGGFKMFSMEDIIYQ
jgi:hypothetical protein